jgi:membrane protease YdiL (CAAX protease family)
LESISCNNCKETILVDSAFCPTCGSNLIKKKRTNSEGNLNSIIFFYVSIVVFIAITYFVNENYQENFLAEVLIEGFFALIILLFSLFDLKEIIALYRFPKISIRDYLLTFFTPIFTGVTVYIGVEFINKVVDPDNSINTYAQYLYLEHPLAWGIFFVAILPPIFEELAFRGYLFNLLKRVTNARNTIIATSFLFALVHFSFISIIWIFPFGLLLGYLRNKYNTLWLGMIIHFIHNLIVLLLDYFVFNFTIVGT